MVLLGASGTVAGRHFWAEAHFRAAQRALEKGDLVEGQAHLDQCLRVWSNSSEAHFLAARTARRMAAYDDAEWHLKEYQRLGGVPEAIDLEKALLLAQRGDLKRVEGNLLLFVQQGHPDAVLILEALSRGLLKVYRLEHALFCLEQWLKRRPDDVQALLWRGDVRERLPDVEGALDDYRRVVELDPNRDEARLHYAELLLREEQPQEALRHYEHLHERQPANPAVLVGLARCRRLLGESQEARRLLDLALAASPRHPDALSLRGRLELEENRPADAEPWLRQAFALAPHDRETAYSFAHCLQLCGKEAEAEKVRDRVKAIDALMQRTNELAAEIGASPHDPAPRHEMGTIFLRSGQSTEGLRWLQSALQEDPDYRPTHEALAEYFTQVGDETQAVQHRQEALRSKGK
jgi:tetratricopeptide (TPR) repeat protein